MFPILSVLKLNNKFEQTRNNSFCTCSKAQKTKSVKDDKRETPRKTVDVTVSFYYSSFGSIVLHWANKIIDKLKHINFQHEQSKTS